MWIRNDDFFNNIKVNNMAGKILVLCQKFEFEVKNILTWMVTADKLIKEEYDLLSEKHEKDFQKISNFLLGKSLEELQGKFGDRINSSSLEFLKQAKLSRNYLAHESFLNYISDALYSKESSTHDRDLKKHIENVAKGDFIVTSWNYEFHEREPQNFKKMDLYVYEIVEWIMTNQQE